MGLEISRAVSQLHQQKGASPSVREIAERVGATDEEVLEAMDAMTAYSADPKHAGALLTQHGFRSAYVAENADPASGRVLSVVVSRFSTL